MAFKMKNPSIAKMVKMAGDNRTAMKMKAEEAAAMKMKKAAMKLREEAAMKKAHEAAMKLKKESSMKMGHKSPAKKVTKILNILHTEILVSIQHLLENQLILRILTKETYLL